MKVPSIAILLALVGGPLAACHGTAPSVPGQDATSQAPSGAPSAPPAPPAFGAATINAALREAWAKQGVAPAPPVDDLRFLRRVYLDVVGTVPPPAAIKEFTADARPDKRARLVDGLLASPGYAIYWASLWEDTLVGWNTREPMVDRGALREWLEAEFQANAPWDKVVTGLLTATGQNSRGGKRFEGATSPGGMPEDDAPPEASGAPINGAVNWFLKYRDTPQDLAGNASRIFLGVQIQCAQCHDHKTEKWKQADFRSFAACFVRTRTEPLDPPKTMGKKRARVVDIGRPLPRFAKNADVVPITLAEPKTLDGVDVGASPDTRAAVAAWMTAKTNPWFAKAIVNRMWAHFLGRGFVDPVDDIRESNFTTQPALFAALADDFTQHGNDLKALIRTITATEAYQLAPLPAGTAPPPLFTENTWSHFRMSPLGPNELLRSILDVTSLEGVIAKNNRANLDRIRFQMYQRYNFLFDVDDESAQNDFEGTVAQALALLNGALVGGGASGVPGGALDTILREPGTDADKITALYQRTITRSPSSPELAYWTQYVNEPHPVELAAQPPPPAPLPSGEPAKPLGKGKGKNGKAGKGNKPPGPDPLQRLEARDLGFHPDSRRQAYADLFWALLNSSEFTFNH